MNPFKAVSNFVALFADEHRNEAGFAFGNLFCWVVIYFIIWWLLGYLGPYFLMLVFPIIVVPQFWAAMFWGACNVDDEKTQLKFIWVVLPFFLACFVALNGLPFGFLGYFFDFLKSDFFTKPYFSFINYWWKFFNSLNYFASSKIPYKFYAFNLVWAQWVFIISSVWIPVIFYNRYQEKKERIEKEEKELLEAEEREELQKEIALKEAEEKLEDERLLKEEREQKIKEEAKKERQKREIANPDPWGSGFLG